MKKIVTEAVRRSILAALLPYEHYLLRKSSYKDIAPPCFIIGPPRSGTTLIYEALVTKYSLSYISNMAERLYTCPAAATRIGAKLITQKKSGSFESSFGQIRGWGSPSEGGRVWNRWLPEPSFLPPDHAQLLPAEQLRLTIASISKTMNAPFVNKNVMHSVHIALLDRIFPDCYFIEIRREPAANIRSIVRARKKNGGPREENNWWSVKPRAWKTYEQTSAVEQACAQVHCLRDDIALAAEDFSPSRFHVVNYENFCQDPMRILREIKKFIEDNTKRELREDFEIPKRFPISRSPALPVESEKIISKWENFH